jgi:flagellar protein FlgJ
MFPEAGPDFAEMMERARQNAEVSGQAADSADSPEMAAALSEQEAASPDREAVLPDREPGKVVAGKTLSGADLKLYEQCEALEGFLIKNMLSGMRKTVMKSNLIDTGFAGEVYEDMLWDEYAKAYAQKADYGLAEMAYRELKGMRGKVFL